MAEQGPSHLRAVTNVVLDALVQAAERAGGGRPLSMPLLEEIVTGLKESAAFDDYYRRSYSEIMALVAADDHDRRRTNAFGRLVLHPLDPLFETGRLDRGLIANLFSFLHMVLGDEAEGYAARCGDIVTHLRGELGGSFGWDAFFDDPEAKVVLWRVLLRIVESFKRFDPRKDWFIKLMLNRQSAVSVASNAFYTVEHDPAAEPVVFGDEEFALVFHAWFDPFDRLSPRDTQAFTRTFGAEPHAMIGRFLDRLAGCPVAPAGAG